MKKLLVLILIVGLAILMTLMRPEKKAHKEAMMKAVKELVDEEAEERGFGDNIFTNLGKTVVNSAIEGVIGTKLKMHDYYLWNTSYIKMNGEEKLLSVGLLGHVFTFDKKMLREALENPGDIEDADEKEAEE
jgi:hypothetical protein